MKKIRIIGPKGYLDDCIRILHALAVLHIETVPVEGGGAFLQKLPMEKEKLAEKEFLDRAAERLGNLLYLLKPPGRYRAAAIPGARIRGLMAEAAPVEKKVKSIHASRDALIEELSMIGRYEKLLRGFAPIVSRLGGLKNFEIVGLAFEKSRRDITGLLASEVGRITGGSYEMHARDIDESITGVVLTYPKRFDADIRYLLTGKSISEVRLPDEYSGMPLIEALKIMARKKEELPALIRKEEGELEDISAGWYGRLVGLLRAVQDSSDEIGALAYAAQTRFAFVVEGWVPATGLAPLKKRFKGALGDRILVREMELTPEENDRAPVFIKNPWFLKPFEVFLEALPPPRYGSVDPTPYVAFFFPAFYGLIVGDMGYGAITLALSLYLRARFKGRKVLHDMMTVLAVSSVSSMAFGFLFGELFGDLGERLGILRHVAVNRIEALKTLMALALGIGAGHVLLGVMIGLVNSAAAGKRKEAGAKLSYFSLIVSFLAVLGVFFGLMPERYLVPGIAALALSLAALSIIEGALGPLEFVKAIGNILSYVRIMAVGTASVVMALVANSIGSHSKNLVIGIIIAGAMHALNLMLSVLSPAIQSMRLHYVEFFSKFYEGGGRKYTPFRKR